MKQLDRTTLLFELLLGTDMGNVNRKIEEIHCSPEYIRVSSFVPTASSTQILEDVKRRFDAIDIFGILSMQKALEVEQEIIELDRRLQNFPSLNPYLSDHSERLYNLKSIGEIPVEINSEGMNINDFTTHDGVSISNRRKVLKSKLFNWYKEAKKGFAELIDNSKLMLSKVRNSRIVFDSMGFQFVLMALSLTFFMACILIAPSFAGYRDGTLSSYGKHTFTLVMYLAVICEAVAMIIRVIYKTYPFRMASRMRKQIVKQRRLVDSLADRSYEFEKAIVNSVKTPRKINVLITRISVLSLYQKMSASDVFDYVYSEKEYFYRKHKKLLIISNIAFVIAFVLSMLAVFYAVIWK